MQWQAVPSTGHSLRARRHGNGVGWGLWESCYRHRGGFIWPCEVQHACSKDQPLQAVLYLGWQQLAGVCPKQLAVHCSGMSL